MYERSLMSSAWFVYFRLKKLKDLDPLQISEYMRRPRGPLFNVLSLRDLKCAPPLMFPVVINPKDHRNHISTGIAPLNISPQLYDILTAAAGAGYEMGGTSAFKLFVSTSVKCIDLYKVRDGASKIIDSLEKLYPGAAVEFSPDERHCQRVTIRSASVTVILHASDDIFDEIARIRITTSRNKVTTHMCAVAAWMVSTRTIITGDVFSTKSVISATSPQIEELCSSGYMLSLPHLSLTLKTSDVIELGSNILKVHDRSGTVITGIISAKEHPAKQLMSELCGLHGSGQFAKMGETVERFSKHLMLDDSATHRLMTTLVTKSLEDFRDECNKHVPTDAPSDATSAFGTLFPKPISVFEYSALVSKAQITQKEKTCAICQDPVTFGEPNTIGLPCGHVCHFRNTGEGCSVKDWITKNKTCPNCRAKLSI